MPLNVHAKAWQPAGALSQQLLRMRLNEAATEKVTPSEAVSPLPQGTSPASSSVGEEREEQGEILFEDGFERVESVEGTNSYHTTPRTSLVGPSLLPSPAESPQFATSLLLMAEEDRKDKISCAAKGKGDEQMQGVFSKNEQRSSESVLTVVTHVETEASAAASSAAGGCKKLGPEDFEFLRVVGQGAFGKVFQVRKRDTREVFAMKVMRKDRILKRQHGEYVRAERDVLTAIVHPYIVTLRYSFQTNQKLYLVLDFINGGHLFFQLYRAGTFDESLARLYTAELVLAVAHLHSLGFVHRDLKPENVLLDADGHIRVTDFGLAKGNISDAEHQRTNSFIGTMEYMSPEVIAGSGHGKVVDWWSVGILLYEMLCGVPPFRAKSRSALQKQITSSKIKLPTYLSSEACSLLKGLLQKDATKRLGFGPNGSKDIMAHQFFKSVDWKRLEARGISSPFKPNIKSHESVENFDKIWTDLPPQDSPCATPTKDNACNEHNEFEGFTYCAPSFLAEAMATYSPKRHDNVDGTHISSIIE